MTSAVLLLMFLSVLSLHCTSVLAGSVPRPIPFGLTYLTNAKTQLYDPTSLVSMTVGLDRIEEYSSNGTQTMVTSVDDWLSERNQTRDSAVLTSRQDDWDDPDPVSFAGSPSVATIGTSLFLTLNYSRYAKESTFTFADTEIELQNYSLKSFVSLNRVVRPSSHGPSYYRFVWAVTNVTGASVLAGKFPNNVSENFEKGYFEVYIQIAKKTTVKLTFVTKALSPRDQVIYNATAGYNATTAEVFLEVKAVSDVIIDPAINVISGDLSVLFAFNHKTKHTKQILIGTIVSIGGLLIIMLIVLLFMVYLKKRNRFGVLFTARSDTNPSVNSSEDDLERHK